ncbi:hypothetical protein EBZ39_05205 [bacterium]|nr:hypothetical protein [bacterium]
MTLPVQIKRGSSAYLANLNPVLGPGEPCLETDTNRVKYGDGTTPWNLLVYSSGGEGLPGTDNDAAGVDSFAVAGTGNTVSGDNSIIAGGSGNTVSGDRSSVVGGSSNAVSGSDSAASGSENSVSGDCSMAVGESNSVLADCALAAGRGASAKVYGSVALSSGSLSSAGDAQHAIYHLRAFTDSAGNKKLTADGTDSPAADRRLVLDSGSAWSFEIKAAAKEMGDSLMAVWSIRGGICRSGDGTASLTGEVTKEVWSDEDWSGDLFVSATDGELVLEAEGQAGKDIYWLASVRTSEVSSFSLVSSDMFVDINAGATVYSLNASVSGGDSSMYPAFDPEVYDYCVHADSLDGTASYTVTINGTPQSGTADVNKCIRVIRGSKAYHIRIIPSDLPTTTITFKDEVDYVPGYYLRGISQSTGGQAPYFVAYDENGVPVWYLRKDYFSPFSSANSHMGWMVQPGDEPNRLSLATYSDIDFPLERYVATLGLNSISSTSHLFLNSSDLGHPDYGLLMDAHEALVVKGPQSRKENFMCIAGQGIAGNGGGEPGPGVPGGGGCIQEQSPDGQSIVWEWFMKDYFNTEEIDYHMNSLDVHPVTGDLVVSIRNKNAIMCVAYDKSVKWVMEASGGSHFQSIAKTLPQTANTKWLTISGEASGYNGTHLQHHASWCPDVPSLYGGSVITVFDNDAGSRDRGVMYEINTSSGTAHFRGHILSEDGSGAPWQGSFHVLNEEDGSFSHCLNSYRAYDQPTNYLREYKGDSNGSPTSQMVFKMQMYGNPQYPGYGDYRIIKVRKDFLDIDVLRTTAGRPW